MVFQFQILGYEAYYVLWVFFLCALLGNLAETVFCASENGVIDSRAGIVYLPINPLYGVGGVVMAVFLAPHVGSPIAIFLIAALVGSVIEYVTSWGLERFLGAKFWDYSGHPLNINGRICLQYSLYWGVLGLLLVFILKGYLNWLIDAVPRDVGNGVLLALTIVFVFACVVSVLAIPRFGRRVAGLRAAGVDRPRSNPMTPAEVSTIVPDKGLDKVVGVLAPDRLMVFNYPAMDDVNEYVARTGQDKIGWYFAPKGIAATYDPSRPTTPQNDIHPGAGQADAVAAAAP